MDPSSQGTSNPAARYASTAYVLPSSYNCSDFTEFKDLLLLLRKSNDNFKFQLNKINTPGQCEEVWKQINHITSFRRQAILDCLNQSQATLDSLSSSSSLSPSSSPSSSPSPSSSSKNNAISNEKINSNTARDIKRIAQKMDLLRSEQDIEDILQRQAEKLFHRACPSYVFQSQS